ncbi:MAG: hypothetical protein PHC88_10835 [Terrimicrobiaceae bacterium]|nr:hypothetical protein [Terrimicrobiaceae bacterium]
MTESAHVTSISALGDFRARLIVFRDDATRSLDEVSAAVRRMRQWIRNDQRSHWESEVRRRRKKLDEVLQELMGARLASLRDATAAQETAVTKTRRALREAEEKLRRVKYWDRNFDIEVDPIVKRMGGLRTTLDHEMPAAIAFLANAQRALDVYSGRMSTGEPIPVEETPVEDSEPS